MDLFSELIAAVQSDMTIGSESSLFPLDTVKLAINRAYRRAGGLFRWPDTEDAQKTSSTINQEYYDYPDNWRPHSIWKLEVDGVDYGDPLVFKDYLYEKENNFPSGLKTMWANQWRRFFIYPTPILDGNINISLWGQKVVDKLVDDTDTTIFSYALPECNDAIVLEACEIIKYKGEEEQVGQLRSNDAKQILMTAWNRIKQENAKYEKTLPFFDVPDLFGRRTDVRNKIGNF